MGTDRDPRAQLSTLLEEVAAARARASALREQCHEVRAQSERLILESAYVRAGWAPSGRLHTHTHTVSADGTPPADDGACAP